MNPHGRQLPLEPTPELRELVERAAGLGLTRQQIAATIKNPATGTSIHQATLTDHFGAEIEAGQARLITEVSTSLWRLALHGENERERRAACEFLLSRRGGPSWQERSSVNLDVDMHAHVINDAHERLQAKIDRYVSRTVVEHAQPVIRAIEQQEQHNTPSIEGRAPPPAAK